MAVLNAVLARLTGAILSPFLDLHPIAGLGAVSLLAVLGLLAIFKATSNQAGLAFAKRGIRAGMYEMRLFRDDLPSTVRAAARILGDTLKYMRLSFVPWLWAAIPATLLVAQLQLYYGYDGLQPGRPAVLSVRLKPGATEPPDLVAPHGLRVETPVVWTPSLREAAWRITADEPGSYELTIVWSGGSTGKAVTVSNAPQRRSPLRLERRFFNQLLHPGEAPLPDAAPIQEIAVTYATRSIAVLGWRAHWLVVFLALSTAFALALKKPLGVII